MKNLFQAIQNVTKSENYLEIDFRLELNIYVEPNIIRFALKLIRCQCSKNQIII